jgi:uncharacterized protein (UPF0264 family)
MPKLLVSIKSLDEAALALDNNVDIIDLKYPANGALGALSVEEISTITDYIRIHDHFKMITATIGDLPMQPDLLYKAADKTVNTGVDVVKIGFFDVSEEPIKAYAACINALQGLVGKGVKLVAVLFAELNYPAELIVMLKNAGFYGVMLDTVRKNGRTLFDYLSHQQIRDLVLNLKELELQSGLAGSLMINQVSFVKQFEPNYIGLRGGLCVDNARANKLCSKKLEIVSKQFKSCCNFTTY